MDKQREKHQLAHLMSRVLQIRYTDLEEEKALCLEILKKTDGQEDMYAKAFAHTYLGDYYVAVNIIEKSGEHLLKALSFSEQAGECDEINLRIFTLLGLYYKHKADEQNSIKYYLDALFIAEKNKDTWSKCLILNNMGFAFQRHNKLDLALKYFNDAYNFYKLLSDPTLEIIFLTNISETLIMMGRYEEAFDKIKKFEEVDDSSIGKESFISRLWCFYYSKIGEKEKCLEWAKKIMHKEGVDKEDRMFEFENYSVLFNCMMEIGHDAYARDFLAMMDETIVGGGVDQHIILENARVSFVLRYEKEENHFAAYRHFYEKTLDFRAKINASIASSMKAEIQLDELNRAKERLRDEQKNLRHQYDIDELTNIYNRRFMDKYIQDKMNSSCSGNLAMIMLDVDYFKEYNDTYKHIMGDFVLKSVSDCLCMNKVEGIFTCRYGGDEFACICDEVDLGKVTEFVKKVQEDLYTKNIEHRGSYCSDRVTLSIGICMGRWEDDPYYITEMADQALYESKRKGRNIATIKKVGVTVES